MRRFYAPQSNFDGRIVQLAEDEAHHLRDVLRLGVGDAVRIYDGEGAEYDGRITTVEKRSTQVEIIGAVSPTSPESPLDLTLAAVLLKGDKFDLVVQKAAELGVTSFIPLYSARCEVRSTDQTNRMTRWLRISQASIRQSGRARNMEIAVPFELKSFVEKVEPASTILFSERAGSKLPSSFESKKMTAIVGPEGGWADPELELVEKAGLSIVTLGGRVVRADTASIAITAILLHRFGDIS